MPYSFLQRTLRGWLGLESNETVSGSLDSDPASFRLATPIYPTGGGGGKISFNASINPGGVADLSGQTEMAVIRGQQDESVRGDVSNPRAEINFQLHQGPIADTDDKNMIKVIGFTVDRFTVFKKELLDHLKQLLGLDNVRFYSGNRHWCWNPQDDGSLVLYDTKENNPDETTWEWKWALRPTGVIEVNKK